jgi:hypothetical protein
MISPVPQSHRVTSDDPDGSTYRTGFVNSDGGKSPKTFLVEPGDSAEKSAMIVADALAREPEPRLIVLLVAPDVTTPILRAIRRRGIRSTVILASGAADDAFARQFVNDPEELDSSGFFTENVFAIAPIILDNTGQTRTGAW